MLGRNAALRVGAGGKYYIVLSRPLHTVVAHDEGESIDLGLQHLCFFVCHEKNDERHAAEKSVLEAYPVP